VIDTLAVDGYALCCYIWYSEEALARAAAKRNNPLINGQSTNFIIFDMALQLHLLYLSEFDIRLTKLGWETVLQFRTETLTL